MRKQQLTSKNAWEGYDFKKPVTLSEGLEILKKNVKGNFDHAFELQISLKLPEKNKKDVIRFTVSPKHNFSKEAIVVVLCDAKDQSDAKAAGADFVGLEDLVEKMIGGWVDFDVVIATPSVMAKIAKLGKVLGPKGLMPNPKTETVTNDIDRVVKSYKAGKLNFKSSENNVISMKIGKFSMENTALLENASDMVAALKVELKKYTSNVLSKCYMKTSMSKAIRVSL